MCLGAIIGHARRAFFMQRAERKPRLPASDDQFIYEEMKRPAGQRRIPSTQILCDESQAIFAAWAAQENKQSY